MRRIFAEASITARPFFGRRGFRVVREQRVAVRGVELANSTMEKVLRGPESPPGRPAPQVGLTPRQV